MYSYSGSKIGQGRENAKEYLKTNPQFVAEIEAKIIDEAGLKAKQSAEKPDSK
jgi:recombination protein RecA